MYSHFHVCNTPPSFHKYFMAVTKEFKSSVVKLLNIKSHRNKCSSDNGTKTRWFITKMFWSSMSWFLFLVSEPTKENPFWCIMGNCLFPCSVLDILFRWAEYYNKKIIFIKACLFTWQVDVKQNQKRLVEQLMAVLTSSPGPSTRYLLAHCVALVYRVGESLTSSLTVDRCHDIIKSKDDSPSFLPTRLWVQTAITHQLFLHTHIYSCTHIN